MQCANDKTSKSIPLSVPVQQCFLSVAHCLFNKHLHLTTCVLYLLLSTVFLLAECIYITYSLFVFIDILNVKYFFNNPEYGSGAF